MLKEKQLQKMEKAINESFEIANKRFNKYNVEFQDANFKPFHLFLGTGNYVRMSNRPPNGSIVVAVVELEEKKQGKGYFKDLYKLLEKVATERDCQIVFESVLNDKLIDFLKREGYSEYMESRTFYKHFGPSADINIQREKEELETFLKNINKGVVNGIKC